MLVQSYLGAFLLLIELINNRNKLDLFYFHLRKVIASDLHTFC